MQLAFIIIISLLCLIAGYYFGYHHTFDTLLLNLAKGKL